MSEKQSQEDLSLNAGFNVMMRTYAPALTGVFVQLSFQWKVPVSKIYLVYRYKEGVEPTSNDAAIVEFRCLKSTLVSEVDTSQEFEDESMKILINSMFPNLVNLMREYSTKWNIAFNRLFYSIYIKTEEGKKDTIGIQLRAAKSDLIEDLGFEKLM